MTRLAVLAGLLLGAATQLALVEPEPPCARLDQGTVRGDGVFFAVGCAGTRSCTIGDATSPIAREVVPAGVQQDCVAFNQYIGAGLNAIPGSLTGECYAFADVGGRRLYPEHRCGER